MSTFLAVAAVVFALVGAVAAIVFVLVYSQPPFVWRTYEAGRHLMRFTGVIAAVLSWSFIAFLLRYFTDDADWVQTMIEYGRPVVFGLAAFMMVDRCRILFKARREGKHHDHEDDPVQKRDEERQDAVEDEARDGAER